MPYSARSAFAFFKRSPIFFDSSSQEEMNLPTVLESFSNCTFAARAAQISLFCECGGARFNARKNPPHKGGTAEDFAKKLLPYSARSAFAFFKRSPIFFDSSSQEEMNLPTVLESFSNCTFAARAAQIS
ncbi:MAG: hypothetical protein DBX55_04555, partial [Verrucomicrobia bacterium]